MSAVSPRSDEWHIKGVPDEARMLVDMHVARHRLKRKTGEAVRQLIVAGYEALNGPAADDWQNQKQSGTRPDSIIAGDAEIVGDQQVHW